MKQWLGFAGVVGLLLAICALFMFVVPLESYSGALCDKGISSASAGSCACSSVNFRTTPAPSRFDYHLLRGEMQAYQDAKPLVNTCNGDKPLRLFL